MQRRSGQAGLCVCVWCLHEQAAGCRHGPLLSPAWTFKGVTEGALPQHGFHQDLKSSQSKPCLPLGIVLSLLLCLCAAGRGISKECHCEACVQRQKQNCISKKISWGNQQVVFVPGTLKVMHSRGNKRETSLAAQSL